MKTREFTRPCQGCGRRIAFARNPNSSSGKPGLPVELDEIRVVEVAHKDPRDPTPTFAVLLESGRILQRARRWRGLETDTASPLSGRVLHFST